MSKSKYTSGPWYRISKEGEAHKVSAKAEGCAPWICEVYGGLRESTVVANADLIATAPEMLEVLEIALRHSNCPGENCAIDWHDLARVIIAKAKGEL